MQNYSKLNIESTPDSYLKNPKLFKKLNNITKHPTPEKRSISNSKLTPIISVTSSKNSHIKQPSASIEPISNSMLKKYANFELYSLLNSHKIRVNYP